MPYQLGGCGTWVSRVEGLTTCLKDAFVFERCCVLDKTFLFKST